MARSREKYARIPPRVRKLIARIVLVASAGCFIVSGVLLERVRTEFAAVTVMALGLIGFVVLVVDSLRKKSSGARHNPEADVADFVDASQSDDSGGGVIG